MRHLVAILSNHDHWRAFPVVGRYDEDTYVFLDHRTPLATRVSAIRDLADADAVDEIVRVVLEPAAHVDCSAGIHDWRVMLQRGRIAATARCRACGDIELLSEPLGDRRPLLDLLDCSMYAAPTG